jgi:hypothetical protein
MLIAMRQVSAGARYVRSAIAELAPAPAPWPTSTTVRTAIITADLIEYSSYDYIDLSLGDSDSDRDGFGVGEGRGRSCRASITA